MSQKPSVTERAYQLADSGEVDGLRRLVDRLHAEGYVNVRAQLDGPTIKKALRERCSRARSGASTQPLAAVSQHD